MADQWKSPTEPGTRPDSDADIDKVRGVVDEGDEFEESDDDEDLDEEEDEESPSF
jgi:hypothetical protein